MNIIPKTRSTLSRAFVSLSDYKDPYILKTPSPVHKVYFSMPQMYSGEPGSGAGKGGGGGGAIREAGGAFGKMEAAREDEYFYKKQKEQLANLKSHLGKEISFHEDQIKRHEDAIRRHKEKMADIENKHN